MRFYLGEIDRPQSQFYLYLTANLDWLGCNKIKWENGKKKINKNKEALFAGSRLGKASKAEGGKEIAKNSPRKSLGHQAL